MPDGATNRAYVTRINLDVAHPDHRITLMTPGDANALTGFNSIDGSTWDPFSQTLLFTQEDGNIGGVIEMGADFDPTTGGGHGLRTLYGSLGRGVTKASILTTRATYGLSRTSAARRL